MKGDILGDKEIGRKRDLIRSKDRLFWSKSGRERIRSYYIFFLA
jgi:hypothetical protein